MKLGPRETNQWCSRTMRAVRRGEGVVLTGQGRPIEVIRPVADAAPARDAAAVRTMRDAGLVVAAAEPGPMPVPR